MHRIIHSSWFDFVILFGFLTPIVISDIKKKDTRSIHNPRVDILFSKRNTVKRKYLFTFIPLRNWICVYICFVVFF